MKYIWLTLPLVLGLAACSKVEGGSQKEATTSSQATDARDDTAPGIDPSVAPGVAFDFSYGFTLPERQIAAVQERHATLCASLGTMHCRVIAIHFDKARGGSVNADMTFLLDPAVALGFARSATALVEKADGSLTTSRLRGEDIGKTIIANDKSAEAVRTELAKIDAQLRIPGLPKAARDQLVAQSGALRAELRTFSSDRDAKVESITTTPVRFDYNAAPIGIGESWQTGIENGAVSVAAITALLAYLLAALGPWAIVGAGVWWGIRKLRNSKPTAPEAMP